MKIIVFPYDEYDNYRDWMKTINWEMVEFNYEKKTITVKYKEK
jgi:hypothetical protein